MAEREEVFAREYLIDMNATAAALRAGYTRATARNAANWIRGERPTKPRLKEHIDRLVSIRTDEIDVTVDRVLQELQKSAFGDDIAMRDKLRALEMVAKYLGMLTGRHQQTPTDAPRIIDDVTPPECEECPHRLRSMEP